MGFRYIFIRHHILKLNKISFSINQLFFPMTEFEAQSISGCENMHKKSFVQQNKAEFLNSILSQLQGGEGDQPLEKAMRKICVEVMRNIGSKYLEFTYEFFRKWSEKLADTLNSLSGVDDEEYAYQDLKTNDIAYMGPKFQSLITHLKESQKQIIDHAFKLSLLLDTPQPIKTKQIGVSLQFKRGRAISQSRTKSKSRSQSKKLGMKFSLFPSKTLKQQSNNTYQISESSRLSAKNGFYHSSFSKISKNTDMKTVKRKTKKQVFPDQFKYTTYSHHKTLIDDELNASAELLSGKDTQLALFEQQNNNLQQKLEKYQRQNIVDEKLNRLQIVMESKFQEVIEKIEQSKYIHNLLLKTTNSKQKYSDSFQCKEQKEQEEKQQIRELNQAKEAENKKEELQTQEMQIRRMCLFEFMEVCKEIKIPVNAQIIKAFSGILKKLSPQIYEEMKNKYNLQKSEGEKDIEESKAELKKSVALVAKLLKVTMKQDKKVKVQAYIRILLKCIKVCVLHQSDADIGQFEEQFKIIIAKL